MPEADIRRPNFTDRNKKLSESWLEFAASYPWSYSARAKEGRPSCTQTHGINAARKRLSFCRLATIAACSRHFCFAAADIRPHPGTHPLIGPLATIV